MKTTIPALLSAVMVLFSADPATAQDGARSAGWWDWALPLVVDDGGIHTPRGEVELPPAARTPGGGERWEERGRWAERRRGRRGRRRGPPFCRNGEGHPVFGLEWCRRKGFGGFSRWERIGWEDVIFDRPRQPRYPRRGTIGRGGLIDVLGDIVFGRLRRQSRRTGLEGPLTGRWYMPQDSRAAVLQIRAGDTPLAELSDVNGDGRVDAVLLNPRR